jgi:hypothetical protein
LLNGWHSLWQQLNDGSSDNGEAAGDASEHTP